MIVPSLRVIIYHGQRDPSSWLLLCKLVICQSFKLLQMLVKIYGISKNFDIIHNFENLRFYPGSKMTIFFTRIHSIICANDIYRALAVPMISRFSLPLLQLLEDGGVEFTKMLKMPSNRIIRRKSLVLSLKCILSLNIFVNTTKSP